MKQVIRSALLLIIAALAPGVVLVAAAAEKAAKTQGEVAFDSSLNNEQIVSLIDAFKRKHPSIEASFYRAT
jgi:ABC-type glycerol-3-phosphate transport system substrate-binding protein